MRNSFCLEKVHYLYQQRQIWYSLRRDFDSFVNKLRYRVSRTTKINFINVNHTKNISNLSVRQLGNPSIGEKSSNVNFRKEKTNISSLEAFIKLVEKDLFKPSNYNKIKGDLLLKRGLLLKNCYETLLKFPGKHLR